MRVHQMWNAYPALKTDLSQVLELIEKHIRVRDKTVETTIRNLVHSGGKLLRPAYSLLCSEIGPNNNKEKSIAVAAALETLHMATLVHDDVIDEAETRHGNKTIHTNNGNKFAIYAGDYLFCVCFTILSRHANSLAHLEFNARGMEKILSGELDQLNSRYQSTVSVKNYLSRVSGKTAQLFAVSCYSGAITSDASRRQAMLAWNMGHYMGMAFQIIDDILDYQGTSDTLGKPVMADIRQGIYNLPIIYAMQENQEAFKPLLSKGDTLTDEDLEKLMDLINRYQGVEKARHLAKRYTHKAIAQIKKMPKGDYREKLLEITTTLLNRNV
ncbi:polyprenyl synthetase family protein [Aquibacillus koreensis]|uniref:Polyprenyl synthetase family protein n=1 Tax=Aquibacillus koreensis TaxID=279446 RepID=A0A9X4AK11_9BACI|nr:polyprenyl synthetase family protein [Aquibacillus koreensis]MCT2534302.1 polyprenyl synthetase family protein [Aquibacillus koreensis]MDC3422379.1 polyprenyl synthetase family protein [Aquibacillus koreensis]